MEGVQLRKFFFSDDYEAMEQRPKAFQEFIGPSADADRGGAARRSPGTDEPPATVPLAGKRCRCWDAMGLRLIPCLACLDLLDGDDLITATR